MVKSIPKIHKRSFFDAYFFGYVSSIVDNVGMASKEKAVLNFMNKHGLSEEVTSINTYISKYQRMQKEYFEMQKETGLKTDNIQ